MEATLDASLAEVLVRLETRLDRLERKIDAIGHATSGVGTVIDRLPHVAEAAGVAAQQVWDTLEADGVDPIATGQRGIELARKAVRPEMLALAERLMARTSDVSMMLDAMDKLDAQGMTRALVETRGEPIQPAGLFAALRAMGDPDLQRAVGFALALGKRVGALLK